VYVAADTSRLQALRDLVRGAAKYSYFAEMYRHLALDTDFDFGAVPQMTRDDITASVQEVVRATDRRRCTCRGRG
jgi:hypothetical protein